MCPDVLSIDATFYWTLFGEMFLLRETLQVHFKMLEIRVAPCVHLTTWFHQNRIFFIYIKLTLSLYEESNTRHIIVCRKCFLYTKNHCSHSLKILGYNRHWSRLPCVTQTRPYLKCQPFPTYSLSPPKAFIPRILRRFDPRTKAYIRSKSI